MSEFSVVFTGQGSQKPGMANDFVEKYNDSKELFNIASAKLGFDLLEICLSEDGRLDRTEYSQPALLTAEMVIYNQAKTLFKLNPCAYAGHSLGEYSALVAAGVISFEDAVLIVRKRGELMQNALPDLQGAMLAIVYDNIESTDYAAIVKKSEAEVANFNSPGQIVVSGCEQAINNCNAELAAAYPEMRLIKLNVATPFHSSYMKSIEPAFKEYISSFQSNMKLDRCVNVLSNFTGTFHKPESLIDNLIQQISGSVRWTANMETLKSLSADVIEFGPGRVLSKFCSAVGMNAKSVYDLRSMEKNLVVN